MTTDVERPVEGTDRVSDVLARDEALVEVFVRHAPQFDKLRSRTMRKVMGRLVTVQDAARMAGVEVDVLLRDLNGALGTAPATAVPAHSDSVRTPAVQTLSHPATGSVVEVDVREELRAGREPFSRIMAAVGSLNDGEILLLRATFEPVPLFAMLEKRGFAHEAVSHAPDDWSIWFWRAEPPQGNAPATAERDAAQVIGAPGLPTVYLDVRGLEPPEPLVRTLAALETLPEGHQLVHVNVRVPQILLPMLAERGFACELDESHADRVLLRIWRPA